MEVAGQWVHPRSLSHVRSVRRAYGTHGVAEEERGGGAVAKLARAVLWRDGWAQVFLKHVFDTSVSRSGSSDCAHGCGRATEGDRTNRSGRLLSQSKTSLHAHALWHMG